MYLVIKEINGVRNAKQIPLRLYENVEQAYNFAENYLQESSGEKWHKEFIPKNVYKSSLLKQRWCRTLKNGDTEILKVRYMKVYK